MIINFEMGEGSCADDSSLMPCPIRLFVMRQRFTISCYNTFYNADAKKRHHKLLEESKVHKAEHPPHTLGDVTTWVA